MASIVESLSTYFRRPACNTEICRHFQWLYAIENNGTRPLRFAGSMGEKSGINFFTVLLRVTHAYSR